MERDNSNNCCRFEDSNGTKLLHKTIVNIESSMVAVVNGKVSRRKPWHNWIKEINSFFD